ILVEAHAARRLVPRPGLDLVEPDGAHRRVLVLARVGEPPAVVRPARSGQEVAGPGIAVDRRRLARLDRLQEERAGLAAARDPLRGGRPGRVRAEGVAVLREAARLSQRLVMALRRSDVELVLAGRVREPRDRLPVGTPGREALGDAARAGQVARAAVLG